MRYVQDYGIGLYAGKKFKIGTEVEHSVGLAAPRYVTLWNELDQYVEAYNETHHLVSGGHFNLFNHAPKSGQMITKARKVGRWIHADQSTSIDTASVAIKPIKVGDQIFSFYESDWFALRNLQEINPVDLKATLPDIIHVGNIHKSSGVIPGCTSKLTTIRKYRDDRTGRPATELIAKRNLTRGTIIEVTRALLLSEGSFLEVQPLHSVLWWKQGYNRRKYYVQKRDRSNVRVVNAPYNHTDNYAVFQTGTGGLYHAYERRPSEINVEYSWWDLSEIGVPSESHFWHNLNNPESEVSESTSTISNLTISDSMNNEVSGSVIEQIVSVDGAGEMLTDTVMQLNERSTTESQKLRRTTKGHICCTRMLISFTAKRDIIKGERLVVDLKKDRSHPGKRFASLDFSSQCL